MAGMSWTNEVVITEDVSMTGMTYICLKCPPSKNGNGWLQGCKNTTYMH